MLKAFASSFCVLLLCFQSRSQVATSYCSGGAFYDQDYTLEQAGLKKLNEDRNYTMGLGIYFSSSTMSKWNIFLPHKWLFNKLHQGGHCEGFFNIMLGNGSFTPDSLPAAYPILNDRPYASITYLQANAAFVDLTKHRLYNYSISAGILGSHISKAVQTYIHTHSNDHDTHDPRTPRGWANQVSEGGAPSLLLTYQQDYLLSTKPLERRESGELKKARRFGGEWKAAWKASVGWYNLVAGELSYRFGWIDPKGWTYRDNPLGSSDMLALGSGPPPVHSPSESYYAKKKKAELYFFATTRINAVGYNVLLSGQGGDDPVTIPNRWVRHGVMDGTAGICIAPVARRILFDFKGKFNFRSPEFQASGRKPRWHYWGGLDLVITVLHR